MVPTSDSPGGLPRLPERYSRHHKEYHEKGWEKKRDVLVIVEAKTEEVSGEVSLSEGDGAEGHRPEDISEHDKGLHAAPEAGNAKHGSRPLPYSQPGQSQVN